jgi:hypothetical protein
MWPYGRNIELFTDLDETLREVKSCNIAPGIAPEDIATSASGYFHPSIQ